MNGVWRGGGPGGGAEHVTEPPLVGRPAEEPEEPWAQRHCMVFPSGP